MKFEDQQNEHHDLKSASLIDKRRFIVPKTASEHIRFNIQVNVLATGLDINRNGCTDICAEQGTNIGGCF